MKISRRMLVGIFYVIIFSVTPFFFSELIDNHFDEFIKKYEKGALIGVEIDITTAEPFADVIVNRQSENGELVVTKGKLFLKETNTYTLDSLPAGYGFHLEETPEHEESVEFRKFLDTWLGPLGHPPDILEEFKKIPSVVGMAISGLQGMLLIIKRNRENEKGFWFYECEHIVIIYIKKIQINLKTK